MENVVTVITAAGWIQGSQVKGEKADAVLSEYAVGLQTDAKDLILLENCLFRNANGGRIERIVLRRSAVLGLMLGETTQDQQK